MQSPLGNSPEVQRGPERWDIIQESNLKGSEVGHPYVLKDDAVGKKISLTEQVALARTHRKKESLCSLEEGSGSCEGLKDVVRLFREKIRRTTAQLELNWLLP